MIPRDILARVEYALHILPNQTVHILGCGVDEEKSLGFPCSAFVQTRKTWRILDWSNPDTERLFDKAINSPTEITEEEKYKIAEWVPSRREMEARIQKYLQQSVDDLLNTAVTDKESLTYPQFPMIRQGGREGRIIWRCTFVRDARCRIGGGIMGFRRLLLRKCGM
ncbi:hypothetical protein BJY01DRAFT_256531 [Aspergillus pseudoustus]|uniref:Uncharacterized protein n=1 Tax=Aspergillus pseudoustus TaxID=1810923 RepID=A0ABR4I8J3_9EURO